MKYYIPTSSLNFNNILSSETISPKSFYKQRSFGYKHWFDIEENNCDDIILLYKEPHEFSRPKSDVEDHPMLIEIDTDETFEEIQRGVYYSRRTIYLNPWQTRFIFFDEKIKGKVLSLSDSSAETKMVQLYRQKMQVSQFEGEYPSIDKYPNIEQEEVKKFIEEDALINKMKGLHCFMVII